MDESQSLIKPPRLRDGDTVCAISLSSGAAGALPHRFEQGKRQLAEVEGPLVGGNIEVLEFLKGTRWWLDEVHWDDALLCLETSDEAPSVEAVKRYLRNYGSQGVLDRVVALLLARPQHYTQRLRRQCRMVFRRSDPSRRHPGAGCRG